MTQTSEKPKSAGGNAEKPKNKDIGDLSGNTKGGENPSKNGEIKASKGNAAEPEKHLTRRQKSLARFLRRIQSNQSTPRRLKKPKMKRRPPLKKAELTYENVYQAYKDCRRRKSNTMQAMKFEFERERNLRKLYDELEDGSYKIGKSICFVIKEPKLREVWAASFRDRIVHHLIYNDTFNRFERRFIHDTYSCLPNKGTLRAAERAESFARKLSHNHTKKLYYCKMDIKSYFTSIDKDVMFKALEESIDKKEEAWLLNLTKQVLYHDPRTNYRAKSPKSLFKRLPAYKSLFQIPAVKGMPIGNLTSQFFSNIYLDKLDQYVKKVLKCRHYIRYVDDIIIFHENPSFLNWAYAKINRFLSDNLLLELNHKKKIIDLTVHGFDFLGKVIKPNHTHIRYRTRKKLLKLVNDWKNNPKRFEKDNLIELKRRIDSYFGMLLYTNSYKLRKEISGIINSLFVAAADETYSKLTIKAA